MRKKGRALGKRGGACNGTGTICTEQHAWRATTFERLLTAYTMRPLKETHAKLMDALAKENFSGASLEVRAELLEFYGHPDALYTTKRKPRDWARVQAEVEQLKKAVPPVVPPAADGPVQPGLSSE